MESVISKRFRIYSKFFVLEIDYFPFWLLGALPPPPPPGPWKTPCVPPATETPWSSGRAVGV